MLLRCDAGEPPGTRLYAPRAQAWLAEVHLAPDADRTLQRLVRLYREIHRDAQAADADARQRAALDPIATTLEAMVGMGPVLALTVRAEIGDIARFPRGSALACYAGLVPRVASSADRHYSGRITRAGSPWLRWALVEMARHAIRRPDKVGRWARRLAVRKGLSKARVALARVLCDEIVTTWTKINEP